VKAGDGLEEEWFGISVALENNLAIIGKARDNAMGLYSGSAYIFENTQGTWQEIQKLLPFDGQIGAQFGWSVAISDNQAVIGAVLDDTKGVDSGAAYIFQNSNGTWEEHEKLSPEDGGVYDNFGISVSMAGNNLIVGAWKADYCGAAYVYEYDSTVNIKSLSLNQKLRIYPNPSKDIIHIELSDYKDFETHVLEIYNTSGKLVYQTTVLPGQKTIKLNTGQWEKSIFSVIIKKRNSVINMTKFVVQ